MLPVEIWHKAARDSKMEREPTGKTTQAGLSVRVKRRRRRQFRPHYGPVNIATGSHSLKTLTLGQNRWENEGHTGKRKWGYGKEPSQVAKKQWVTGMTV